MKITGVRTRIYEFRGGRVFADANLPSGNAMQVALAVFLDTDAGLTGVTITGPGAAGPIQGLTQSCLVGQDPRGVRGLWKRMVDSVFKNGNRGVMAGAVSALDIALWDLKAKAADEPLWRTLGASVPKVKAYASGIDLALRDEELDAFYRGMAARGVNAGKLKVGLDEEADERRIGIMRDALASSGKRPILMIDSNEYWSAKQAIRHISALEEQFDLFWVEEPARRWDYRGLRQVSRSVRAGVATGENLHEIGDFMSLIDNEAVDVVQVGAYTGGITGAMQIADLAYGFELPVSMMNCPGNFMAPLAAAIPNHSMMEVTDAGMEVCFTVDNRIEDGYIVMGETPGAGLVFDEEKLAALEVESVTPGRMPGWGRRRGAGLFIVGPDEPDDLHEG